MTVKRAIPESPRLVVAFIARKKQQTTQTGPEVFDVRLRKRDGLTRKSYRLQRARADTSTGGLCQQAMDWENGAGGRRQCGAHELAPAAMDAAAGLRAAAGVRSTPVVDAHVVPL